jgi:hypothetical protein
VPERTCLVRVGDTLVSTRMATYRVWMSDDVVNTFRSRPNLSNELMDCTFVYNDTRSSTTAAFVAGQSVPPQRRQPRPARPLWLPDQVPRGPQFRGRTEINLDNTEGSNRGPLQERASYWFYEKMGLQYSRQEWVRLILNGQPRQLRGRPEDRRRLHRRLVPEDNDGYLHKIDDYFEYSADGTQHRTSTKGSCTIPGIR